MRLTKIGVFWGVGVDFIVSYEMRFYNLVPESSLSECVDGPGTALRASLRLRLIETGVSQD